MTLALKVVPKRGVLEFGKLWIFLEKLGCVIPCFDEPVTVSHEVRELEWQAACLASSQEFARTPDFQVRLGDLESVIRVFEDFQALRRGFARFGRREQKAIRLGGAPSHPAP